MRRHPLFRAVTILTLLLFTSSCVTTQLPPISASGGSFQPLPDELQIWEEARAEEETLLDNVRLYEDPLLESYLEGIVTRLNPPGMANNPAIRYKVRVIEDPTLNAFAYPHGAIYVHTGLLARMENEDELATVLGHEMTHVENRHMLRHRRSAQNKAIGLSVAAVAASVVAAGVEADAYGAGDWAKAATIDVVSDLMIGLGLQLAFLAAVNGYGRGLEWEADEGGFAKVASAGYDLNQAPKVYEALLEDHGEPRKAEAFFFGSHPRLTERIENTKKYLAAHPAPSPTVERASTDESFARRIRPVVRDDARLNIAMSRFKIAEDQLQKAQAWMPEDPQTRYLRGRLRLAQAEAEKDSEAQRRLRGEAADAFREAIELDDKRPDPHRDLGLLLYLQEDFARSCAELRRYVKLAPDAEDTPRIRDYILELQKDKHCN
ncbi:MAG TPA: M48 family metalloprotease [Thermoanaerobaculia bacterium]